MPLFCRFCSKEFLLIRDAFRHLKVHGNDSFDCGLSGCAIKGLSFISLRSHLYNHHSQIYNENYIPSDFFVLNDSFITLTQFSNDIPSETFLNTSDNLQDSISLGNSLNIFDAAFEIEIKKFLSILVKNGFKKMHLFK